METTIQITGWKGAIFVVGLVIFAFWMNHRIYYYNPDLDETITALQSDDPATIAQALVESQTLGMAKGQKLIPYILFYLVISDVYPMKLPSKEYKTSNLCPEQFQE